MRAEQQPLPATSSRREAVGTSVTVLRFLTGSAEASSSCRSLVVRSVDSYSAVTDVRFIVELRAQRLGAWQGHDRLHRLCKTAENRGTVRAVGSEHESRQPPAFTLLIKRHIHTHTRQSRSTSSSSTFDCFTCAAERGEENFQSQLNDPNKK